MRVPNVVFFRMMLLPSALRCLDENVHELEIFYIVFHFITYIKTSPFLVKEISEIRLMVMIRSSAIRVLVVERLTIKLTVCFIDYLRSDASGNPTNFACDLF